jgi:hypothetical protein
MVIYYILYYVFRRISAIITYIYKHKKVLGRRIITTIKCLSSE